MKKISIVVPAHNEENNIEILFEKIKTIFEKSLNYSFEIIFVNDGSKDNTQINLEELAKKNEEVKYIEFSRNFGHQNAVKAGLDYSTGNAVISMDADLQHPPEIIPMMIEKWEQGYDVVLTQRKYPKEISFFKKITSKYFYIFLSFISNIDLTNSGGSDFRLLDKKIINQLKEFKEVDLFLRGLTNWVGFRQITIDFIAAERYSGKSSYNLQKMLKFAFTGITSFSVKPLYLSALLGFCFSSVSLIAYTIYVVYSFCYSTEISGWASLIMTIVFFGGLQLIMLGIIGIYLGKVFQEVKNRPQYIIRSKNII